MNWTTLNKLGTLLLTTAQLVYMAMGAEDNSSYERQLREKLTELQGVLNDLDEK